MIDQPTLIEAAKRFHLDPEAIQPLGGFHQNVFLVTQPEPARGLKFSPVEQLPALKRKLTWMRHLQARDLSVSRPMPSWNGRGLKRSIQTEPRSAL